MRDDQTSSGSPTSRRAHIEVRLRDIRQLFDAMDPSPFREKDLAPKAEEYIVDSLKELSPHPPREIVIHLDQPTGLQDEERKIGDAVRLHFARKATLSLRDLRRLRRRGLVSLAIGAAFLAVAFGLSQLVARFASDGAIARLFREGLLIVGWVAMWRPLEIFLYDWWPIVDDMRAYDRLGRTAVRITSGGGDIGYDQLADLLTRGARGASPAEVDSSAAARAISRWENEGGAIEKRSMETAPKRVE
jgi:hypothetical protein